MPPMWHLSLWVWVSSVNCELFLTTLEKLELTVAEFSMSCENPYGEPSALSLAQVRMKFRTITAMPNSHSNFINLNVVFIFFFSASYWTAKIQSFVTKVRTLSFRLLTEPPESETLTTDMWPRMGELASHNLSISDFPPVVTFLVM